MNSEVPRVGMLDALRSSWLYQRVRAKYYQWWFSDEYLIRRQYYRVCGEVLDLDNPRTYNEKLQWLKLNWYDPQAVRCADKYELRDYVQLKVGSSYLVGLLDVYTNADSVRFDALPRQFVLKACHASGWNVLCRDKDALSERSTRQIVKRWLNSSCFWVTREWVYRDMTPKVIAEHFLSDDGTQIPMDYKVFCFGGEPYYIQVDIDRFGIHRRNIYDAKWRLLDLQIRRPRAPDVKVIRPPLDEMLSVARILAKPFPHVRVDFYYAQGKLKVGEMTFFHGGGRERFLPAHWGNVFGDLLVLPKLRQSNEVSIRRPV